MFAFRRASPFFCNHMSVCTYSFSLNQNQHPPIFQRPYFLGNFPARALLFVGRLQVWVVYHSKMKTKQVYLHDSTYATPFSLLLWGARVRHERPRGHTKKEAVEVVIGEKNS